MRSPLIALCRVLRRLPQLEGTPLRHHAALFIQLLATRKGGEAALHHPSSRTRFREWQLAQSRRSPHKEPILERVREVELGHPAPWGEANGRLVYVAESPGEAAQHLHNYLK